MANLYVSTVRLTHEVLAEMMGLPEDCLITAVYDQPDYKTISIKIVSDVMPKCETFGDLGDVQKIGDRFRNESDGYSS